MTKHDWLIKQLADLAEYAALNGLPKISKAIASANLIVKAEFTLQNEPQKFVVASSTGFAEQIREGSIL